MGKLYINHLGYRRPTHTTAREMNKHAKIRAELIRKRIDRGPIEAHVQMLRHQQRQAELQNRVRYLDGLLLGFQPHFRSSYLQARKEQIEAQRSAMFERLEEPARRTLTTLG